MRNDLSIEHNRVLFPDFEVCLSHHLSCHSSVQPQDILKFCYQSAFGAEHLLTDEAAARDHFDREYVSALPRDVPLYESLTPNLCRVDLGAWKKLSLPADYLFRMFMASAYPKQDGHIKMDQYLTLAETAIKKGKASFSMEQWQVQLEQYKAAGIRAVHHSEVYREQEKPCYRVIEKEFLAMLPILQAISSSKKEQVFVIAIDGRAAAGKSTLAQQLCKITGASLITMDDFFLLPALRTPERFMTPGGNIHHERFCQEVLPFLSSPDAFSYRVFDCEKMNYNGQKKVGSGHIRIVEGSYSFHPVFGKYADLTIFCDVSPEEQRRRILDRNGPILAERFEKEWIPMEETYFHHYHVAEGAMFRYPFNNIT